MINFYDQLQHFLVQNVLWRGKVCHRNETSFLDTVFKLADH